MDDIVKAAMAKWPHVPHCTGWLGLDARGQWFMRDDATQAAGPFVGPASSVRSKGSWLRHDKLIEFIQRNYAPDAHGCWYFQNGPQRVYVELEAAPWIWRLPLEAESGVLVSHTGRVANYLDSLVDEQGRLFVHTDQGLGLVHTQDMHAAADRVAEGQWVPEEVLAADLPARFGFVLSPAAHPSCRRP
ncbi:MAG: DUF2946 family protein [Serpentinimonas sp.]|jgi:hypothetical protein|nr:DUF2946 family protein [Serpentinimonas sp.]